MRIETGPGQSCRQIAPKPVGHVHPRATEAVSHVRTILGFHRQVIEDSHGDAAQLLVAGGWPQVARYCQKAVDPGSHSNAAMKEDADGCPELARHLICLREDAECGRHQRHVELGLSTRDAQQHSIHQAVLRREVLSRCPPVVLVRHLRGQYLVQSAIGLPQRRHGLHVPAGPQLPRQSFLFAVLV